MYKKRSKYCLASTAINMLRMTPHHGGAKKGKGASTVYYRKEEFLNALVHSKHSQVSRKEPVGCPHTKINASQHSIRDTCRNDQNAQAARNSQKTKKACE